MGSWGHGPRYLQCGTAFTDHQLCPETDPDKAVALARHKGITGIAQAYREKKDAENPKQKAAKEKGQATKKARRQSPENSVPRAASAASARVFAQQMDSQPTIISPTREPGQDFCAAAGHGDAMLAFMSLHGISAGIKPELDGDNHVQIYLRVWNSTDKQFQLFGPALDFDLADIPSRSRSLTNSPQSASEALIKGYPREPPVNSPVQNVNQLTIDIIGYILSQMAATCRRGDERQAAISVPSRFVLELIGAISGRVRILGQAARSIGLSASFWVSVCHPWTLRMVI